jgi:glycosyltransferase involved in cell wall biosynthesis
MRKNIKVDIVVIGRNEGELLQIALKSSLMAAREFAALGHPLPNVIYVDSRSTDGSPEVAISRGVECLTVQGVCNPAAGRFLGFSHCNGEYVFFIDGDMEAMSGWLTTAVAYLEAHDEVAGVGGICDWEVTENGKVMKLPNRSGILKPIQPVTTDVGGGFLYRSSVLRQVGGFDPTMTRGGEFEMYLRILAGDYGLMYLKIPMAIHRDRKGSLGLNFFVRTIFTRNVCIPGVVVRKAPHHPAVRRILWRRFGLYFWHTVSVGVLLIAFFEWEITGILWSSLLVVDLLQLGVAHWWCKGCNMKRAFVSLFTINWYLPAFLIGYFFKWPDVGGYYTKHPPTGLNV